MSSSLKLGFGGRKAVSEEKGEEERAVRFPHIEFGPRAPRPEKTCFSRLDLLQQDH